METLIRLSTAHAKARLSNKVEEIDAECAKELLQYALFKEVIERKRKPKRRRTEGDEGTEHSSSEESFDGGDDDEDGTSKQ